MGKWKDIDRIITALDEVEGPEQKAVMMRYLGDYPNEQIAENLGVSPDEAHLLAIHGLQQVKDNFFRK